jgi:hypothetical protein
MLKVVHDADASNENGTAGGSLLDEIVDAPHLVALVRAGARFEKGKLVERPDESRGDQQVA